MANQFLQAANKAKELTEQDSGRGSRGVITKVDIKWGFHARLGGNVFDQGQYDYWAAFVEYDPTDDDTVEPAREECKQIIDKLYDAAGIEKRPFPSMGIRITQSRNDVIGFTPEAKDGPYKDQFIAGSETLTLINGDARTQEKNCEVPHSLFYESLENIGDHVVMGKPFYAHMLTRQVVVNGIAAKDFKGENNMTIPWVHATFKTKTAAQAQFDGLEAGTITLPEWSTGDQGSSEPADNIPMWTLSDKATENGYSRKDVFDTKESLVEMTKDLVETQGADPEDALEQVCTNFGYTVVDARAILSDDEKKELGLEATEKAF